MSHNVYFTPPTLLKPNLRPNSMAQIGHSFLSFFPLFAAPGDSATPATNFKSAIIATFEKTKTEL
jgi:hypothetical protein